MGCAVGTVKFAVFTFNFILVCLGFAMVLFGALDSPLPDDVANIDQFAKEVSITSKVLMIAGGIIFVVAFFGCWGAVSDSSCLLFLYSLFLMALILFEVAAGIYIYVNRDASEKAAEDILKKWISEYKQGGNTQTTIDQIQQKLHCCGIRDKSDWQSVSGSDPPGSCCKPDEKGNIVSSCRSEHAFPEGCLTKGVRLVVEKTKRYMWIVGGIIGVELLTILFALVVRNSIINDRRRSLA